MHTLTQLNQIALNCRFYFDTYHWFISLGGKVNSPRIHDITELKRVPRTAFAAVSKSICDQKTLLPFHTVSKQHVWSKNTFLI